MRIIFVLGRLDASFLNMWFFLFVQVQLQKNIPTAGMLMNKTGI